MANFITILLFVYTCAAAYAGYPWTHHGSHFPIVDVGYGRYQASLNVCFISRQYPRLLSVLTLRTKETGNYYNFSNIRYAEPPVGSLRFSLPVSPRGRDTSVDTGSIARICPQAYPTGGRVNERYNTYYSLTGKTSIAGFENSTQGFDYPRNAPSDSRITEDCLFLDVMVPREIFHARQSRRNKTRTGAAVMVWLHGGGFCAGSKYDTPAAGLIARSQTGDNEGVIYVTLNYRLYDSIASLISLADFSQRCFWLDVRSDVCERRNTQCRLIRSKTCFAVGQRQHPPVWWRSNSSDRVWRICRRRLNYSPDHSIWRQASQNAFQTSDTSEPRMDADGR